MSSNSKLSVKVSPKGCLSVYGLRRFPVSFYADEWLALSAVMPAIEKQIKQNRAEMDERSKVTVANRAAEAVDTSDRTAI